MLICRYLPSSFLWALQLQVAKHGIQLALSNNANASYDNLIHVDHIWSSEMSDKEP